MIGWKYSLAAVVFTAPLLITQPASAQNAAIEDIQLSLMDGNLEILLQVQESTPPEPGTLPEVVATPQATVSSTANLTTVDIVNAQLELAEGERLDIDAPADSISFMSVVELDERTVRITLLGVNSAPEVQVMQTEGGVFLAIPNAGEAGADSLAEAPGETAEGASDEATGTDTTDPATTGSGAVGEDDFVFEEFVVDAERSRFLAPEASTGTRTDTPIRDTPLSIQVVPRAVIEDQGATRLSEALNNVTGVTPGNVTDGADEFRIRGFEAGTVSRNGFRESVFFDRSSPRDTANIEQIEVLSGPSAILFGSLDAGGSINIITKQPQFEPFYDVSFTGGSFSTFRPEIDFNYPITEDGSLRARLNAAYENSESFRDFTSIERTFIAPALAWDITDRTRLNISGEYLFDERPFDRGLLAIGDTIVDIPFGRRLGNPFDELTSEEIRVGYEFEHDLNNRWQLRNAFFYTRVDRNRINTEPGDLDETTGILSRTFFEIDPELFETFIARGEIGGEFNTGRNIEHQLLMGVEWSLQTRDTESVIASAPSIDIFNPTFQDESILDTVSGATIIDVLTRAENLGFYIQDTINISDTIFILLGGRLEIIDDENSDFLFDVDQGFDTTEFTPQAGLVYKPIESVSLYGSYSESFRSNTIALISNVDLVDPEESRQFEVGVKADFLDGNLFATLAAFNIIRENELAPDPDNPTFQVPIGRTRSQGIEASISGEILPGWNALVSYTLTDTEILEDEDLTEGNAFENVPLHSGRIFTTYEIQTGALSGLAFGLGLTAVSEREGDIDNSFQLDPYATVDMALFYRRDDFRLALNFNNVFDAKFISSAGTRTSITPGAPFEFRGTVSWSF